MRIRRAQRFDANGNLNGLNASLALADFRYVLYGYASCTRHTRGSAAELCDLCRHSAIVVFCDSVIHYGYCRAALELDEELATSAIYL